MSTVFRIRTAHCTSRSSILNEIRNYKIHSQHVTLGLRPNHTNDLRAHESVAKALLKNLKINSHNEESYSLASTKKKIVCSQTPVRMRKNFHDRIFTTPIREITTPLLDRTDFRFNYRPTGLSISRGKAIINVTSMTLVSHCNSSLVDGASPVII